MSELKYIQNEIRENRDERLNKERKESLAWPDSLDPFVLNTRYLKHAQFDSRDTTLINKDYYRKLLKLVKRGEDRYKEQQEKKKKKLEKKKNKKLLTNK